VKRELELELDPRVVVEDEPVRLLLPVVLLPPPAIFSNCSGVNSLFLSLIII
jgi:hypothetical protein